MKIVAISGSQVPSNVANSLQAMKAVHALAQLGHDVTLIVPVNGEINNKEWKSLANYYGLKQEFQVEYLPGTSRRLFFISAVQRASHLKPDLLYVWPIQSAVLGMLKGIPVVLEVHDLPSGQIGPHWFRYFRDIKGKKRISVISRGLLEILTEKFGAHFRSADIIMAPNGVELERYESLPEPQEARKALNLTEAPTVVCTGHLYQGRGVELFVELAREFQSQNVQFIWAGGKAEDIETWKTKTQDISNLHFTGFIPNSSLPMYQAAADVLLMPYSREIGISSGMGHSGQVSSPMKMFEYMASGRAIIASDIPVFHEVLNEHNCAFCEPDHAEQWKEAIQSLLADQQKRESLGLQAKKDAQKYSWVQRARNILKGFPN